MNEKSMGFQDCAVPAEVPCANLGQLQMYLEACYHRPASTVA